MELRFVTEAVMLAVYGHLLVPEEPVEFVVPSSTIDELYELLASPESIVDGRDDQEVRSAIKQLTDYLETPFISKKLAATQVAPWSKSSPIPISERASLSVIYGSEAEEFGEEFDPVETELLLTAMYEKAPLLTDQPDLIERMVDANIPVIIVDVDDFEYAVETGLEPFNLD
ncbi:hypothetical protein [Gorillibacterium massiliense]|uniref:hypothetical protein n=1 Tax=Gorillibacterium massiliense TaxID=1280390 RepID=UPI0004B86E99|nr:hypothetical protein [Gorillibacterium massiliense]